MMMQMLRAGGVALFEDGRRTADEDNPRGYFELEIVKQLERDVSWMDGAEGKAVKIVSPLLRHLPAGRPYKVIFMERDLGEVLDSQEAMLERRGQGGADAPRERMLAAFEQHVATAAAWLRAQSNVDTIFVSYAAALADPRSCAVTVARFLGREDLDVGAMAASVDPALHRNWRQG